MKRWPSILLLIGITAGGILGGWVLHAAATFNLLGDCEDTVATRLVSPTRSRVAVLFARNCGATTSFITHLAIGMPGVEPPPSGGNALVATAGGGAPLGPKVPVLGVALHWLAPDTLQVGVDARAVIVTKGQLVEGVTVQWRPLNPDTVQRILALRHP